MRKAIKREIFLEDLPRQYGFGANKEKLLIDWSNSGGCIVRFIYYDIEGEIEIVRYDSKRKLLYIKYLDKENIKISRDSFAKCKLGKLLGTRTNEFKIEIGQTFKDDKRDLIIIDRKNENGSKYYKYHCNICNFDGNSHYKDGEFKEEYWILEGNLLSKNKNGCACCCQNPRITVPHINSIVANPETYWMIPYFQGGYNEAKKYNKSSNKKINPICPDCGQIKNKGMQINTIYNEKTIGCTCGDGFSYGHKYVFNLLKQLELDFKDNKTFEWCKFYNTYRQKQAIGEYDFVIENMKLIIEVDGGWHRQDNNRSGQTKEESEFIDDIKDKLAEDNSYHVIRIYYDDYEVNVKDYIFESELSKLFNLSNINWFQCESFALSNRTKEVCEIKKNNPNFTTTEIGKNMNLEKNTIIRYLKRGTKLGWCKYDPRAEHEKTLLKGGGNKKQVEVFKDGISLGIFESTYELERQSEKLFGVRLLSSLIIYICNGKRPHHKGFTFKYVDKPNTNQTNKESA